MADIIQIYNQKGGVAKTTSTIHLGGEFAKNFGKRVLLFDFDPLCALTKHIACSETPNMYFTDLLKEYYLDDTEEDMHEAICRTDFENIDIVPATREKMEKATLDLANNKFFSNNGSLDPFIEQIEDEYDIVIFDSAAGATDYNLMAMCIANYLIIPTDDSMTSAESATLTIADMLKCKKRFNPGLDFIGIYMSRANGRRRVAKGLEALLGEQFKDKLIPVAIRDGAGVGNAGLDNSPICYCYPNDNIAKDYHNLAEYIIEYIGKGK